MIVPFDLLYFRNARPQKVLKLEPAVIGYYDLTLVLSGELSYRINGEHTLLQAGDILCLPPHTLRSRDASPKEAHYISFNFTAEKDPGLPTVLRDAVTPEIRSLFKVFTPTLISYLNGDVTKAAYVLGYLLETLKDDQQKAHGNPHIRRATDYIAKHISSPITLSTLAAHLHLSREYVAYLFKKETGMTASAFINEQKLLYAGDLILEGEDTLTSISKLLGYENYGYFSRIFKKRFGVSPAEFRKRL